VPQYFLYGEDREKTLNDIISMCDIYSSAYAVRDDILTRWTEDFLTRDPKALLNEFDEAQGKIGPLRSMAVSSLYKKIKVADKTDGKVKDDMRAEFVKLDQYKESMAKAGSFYDQYRAVMPGVTTSADAANIKTSAMEAKDKFAKVSHIAGMSSYIKLLSSDPAAKETAREYIGSVEGFVSSYGAVDSILKFEEGSNFISLAEAGRKMDIILANEEKLRTHILFNQAVAKVKGAGVANIAESYVAGDIKDTDLVPAFRKKVSRELAIRSIDASDVLKNFSQDVFEEKVKQFAQADEEFIKVTREEIYLNLLKRLPDISADANASSALGLLQHAIKSRGRGVSLRSLFSSIGDIILKLCPCVLMSPISVAQYLEPGKVSFDTVIFDEASQIPTAEAVGVLARGKNAVIVGDPNQMPPTTFFQAMQAQDEGTGIEFSDDGIVFDDLESILDDCLAVSVPSLYLAWHYRSRHESLITFSNRSFYDGKLYTFPSADNRVSKVTFEYIDGIFDRGNKRINKKEAEAVVDDIYRRFKDGGGKPCSIGVVTFNINQQYEIDDLVSAKCTEDHEFDEWLFGQEEPLFIKNLENVQGDERDVILFSVGYGKDEEGKIYMNFGPLNRDGGWRRLNVAVTRSRIEMKVFSSLRPEDIKVSGAPSEGVVAFRRFLEYASGSSTWDSDIVSSQGADSPSPVIDRSAQFTGVADEIIRRLEAEGYSCDRNIGRSLFKVDIGVASDEDPEVYRLGILLDGPSYAASKTTSAREVSQPSLLKGLGWKLIRVRVAEWWESPDRVMDQILSVLNAPAEEPALETPAENATEVAQENEVAAEPEAVEGSETESTVPVDSAEEDANAVPADADATDVAEPAATAVANEPSVWTCECGKEGNTGKFCSECGKPAPVAEALTEPVPVESPEDDVKKN